MLTDKFLDALDAYLEAREEFLKVRGHRYYSAPAHARMLAAREDLRAALPAPHPKVRTTRQ